MAGLYFRFSQLIVLHQHSIVNTHHLIGTGGNWNRFAPQPRFSNPKRMLSQDVCFYVVFSADDKQGENTRIGVDLNRRNWISHGSCFTPRRNWVDEMSKTKATPLLFCHSQVRVASGVINCPLALRTVCAVLRVSRLGLFAQLPSDALIADIFCYRETAVLEKRIFRKRVLIQLHKIGVLFAQRCVANTAVAVLNSTFRVLRSTFRVLRSKGQALRSKFRIQNSECHPLKSTFHGLKLKIRVPDSEFCVLSLKGEG